MKRDLDIISKFSNAEVIISITTIDDNERKLLEPYASPVKNRLDVLKIFTGAGIQTSIFFGPILPSISKNNISEIIDTFIAYDISKIWIDSLNLKPGIWSNIKTGIFQNQNMYKAYLKNLFDDKKHYNELRNEIIKIAKKRNLTIIDAFEY